MRFSEPVPSAYWLAYGSLLKVASEVNVIDSIPERFEKAKELGGDSGELQ